MLGPVVEAEDVVQDAWLRWHGSEHEGIVKPEAWLVRTVTRLCLDVLKSARINNGDLGQLKQLLADDVVFYGDGGGKRNSAVNPIYGLDKVTRFFGALAEKGWSKAEVLRAASTGGLPGQLTVEADGMLQTMAVEIDGGKIRAIYVVRNPDKLGHLDRARRPSGV